MIPPFQPNGNLPPGVHIADWPEFVARFGTSPRRLTLLAGLRAALDLLRDAGCLSVYVDGSFVTNKAQPGDFDACWDINGVDAARLDVVFLTFDNGRAAQKARFGGEFFPAQLPEGASGRQFIDFFQTDRNGQPKGIVQIDLQRLP